MLKYITIIYITTFLIVGMESQPIVNKLRWFLENELNIMETLQNHIRLKENHLQKISSQFEPLSAVVSSRDSRDEYLSNALNTLTLVRRLTTEWLSLANIMGLTGKWKDLAETKQLDVVVRNLARLQTTYNLNTDHLAVSVLEDSPANANFTGRDCYMMARHHYLQNQHKITVQWLDQALAKHDNTVPRDWILELKVLAHCFLGDLSQSSSIMSSLLRDFPGRKAFGVLVEHWQFMVNYGCEEAKSIISDSENKRYLEETNSYNRLCQGNSKLGPGLKCRYVHYNKRHLRLAPFRLEELHLDPPVLMFHNVINEVEIQEVMIKVHNELEKSLILDENGVPYEDSYRTSESAWIYPKKASILDNLTKKIGDMTNMDTKFAEAHQISRYGIGGEYLFHNDYFGEIPDNPTGDRIATLMFYLNDVPSGGHTVFLDWQLSVKPQKGSAVFWYNLKHDGSLDHSSRHAGCAVLKGTKWVLNKWFHELNNDVARPCYLDREGTYKYFYL